MVSILNRATTTYTMIIAEGRVLAENMKEISLPQIQRGLH